MSLEQFGDFFSQHTNFKQNRFHPLVWINGEPEIGKEVYIGGMSEINAKGARVVIGDHCDIASFVSINCADSHKKCIGIADAVVRKDITIEDHVFIGSHSTIKGGAHIGHHSVIAAGTVVDGVHIPPYSLVYGNKMQIKAGYYAPTIEQSRVVQHNKPTFGSQEEAAALRVLRSGWVAQGNEVAAFECELAQFLGIDADQVAVVSSGTMALFVALYHLGATGQAVAMPAYVCSAVRNAVRLVGAREHYVDVAPGTAHVNISSLKNVAYTIVPHMYGIPGLVPQQPPMKVIEDAAQSLGARVAGASVGLQGDVGIFSFYATKLITTGGQGGALIARDKKLIEAIKDYRSFDMRADAKTRLNVQMTDMQAAIGRAQLAQLPAWLERRETIFQRYKNAGLALLDISEQQKKLVSPIRYRAIVRTEEPNQMIERLACLGIKAIVPLLDWELLTDAASVPESYQLTQSTVSLPIYPTMSDDDVERVIKGVIG